MKIICTISEFATMVRNCDNGSCCECVLRGICDNEENLEKFVSIVDVTTLQAWRALNGDDQEDEET